MELLAARSGRFTLTSCRQLVCFDCTGLKSILTDEDQDGQMLVNPHFLLSFYKELIKQEKEKRPIAPAENWHTEAPEVL